MKTHAHAYTHRTSPRLFYTLSHLPQLLPTIRSIEIKCNSNAVLLLFAQFFDGCLWSANHVHLLVNELDVAAIGFYVHVFFDPRHNLQSRKLDQKWLILRLTSLASAIFSLSPKCPIEHRRRLAQGSTELFKQSNWSMLKWTRAFSTGLLIEVANMAQADFIISAVTSERATLVEIVKIGIFSQNTEVIDLTGEWP